MSCSQTEVDSLRRQIKFLSGEVARVEREREKLLSAKDFHIIKKVNINDKIQKTLTKLKNEHYELKKTESCLRGEAQANVYHTATLNSEIRVLCAEIDAAKQRIKDLEDELMTNPNTNLRLKIKVLCVKYHPDHGSTMFCSTEVARDLIELLSE